MQITHPFVSPVSDAGDPTIVGPDEWNDDHVLVALTSDPGSPVQGQVWVVVSGVTPTRIAALKIYDGGSTRTIASITY
jgi:hypothetical protein